MTTVAYRDGVIAGDTQVTERERVVGNVTKVGRINGVLWGVSGGLECMNRFRDWIGSGLKGDPPSMKSDNGAQSQAIIVHDGRILSFTVDGWDCMKADFYAMGSGAGPALGAMASGRSAIEAVSAAGKLDIYTGGQIVAFCA